MAVFDIRADGVAEFDEIIIADCESDNTTHLVKGSVIGNWSNAKAYIGNKGEEYFTSVTDEEHARDIIKALEKAISFGWFK